MNNKLIALAVSVSVTAALATPLVASAGVQSKWFGYSQLTLESLSEKVATGSAPAQDGIRFGADRVRIGYKIKDGKVFGKLQVDFNKPSPTKGYSSKGQDQGGFNEIIKDAEAGYKFSNAASIKLGQYKVPVGMDFNRSGKKLDITKRGMEKKLVLERSQGIMLSGRRIAGGVGYDLFYGNAAARSSAVSGSVNDLGNNNSYAARVSYDMGRLMHVELSTGKSSVDGGTDYKVTDFGMGYKRGPTSVQFEYITGKGAKNNAAASEKVWFLHYGYQFSRKFEGVVRYYDAKDSDNNLKLSNLYLGANLYLGSNKTNGRLQINYVIAGGDTVGSTTVYGSSSLTNPGVAKGYTDDAILVQYQVSF